MIEEQFAREIATKTQMRYWWAFGVFIFFVIGPIWTVWINKKHKKDPPSYPAPPTDPNLAQTPEPAPDDHSSPEVDVKKVDGGD